MPAVLLRPVLALMLALFVAPALCAAETDSTDAVNDTVPQVESTAAADASTPSLAAEPQDSIYAPDINICYDKKRSECSLPPQGECGPLVDGDGFSIDWRLSTASCPGTSDKLMKITFADGRSECVFIDNESYRNPAIGAKNYFVPARTRTEWEAYKTSASVRSNRAPYDSGKPMVLFYGCERGHVDLSCGGRTVSFFVDTDGKDGSQRPMEATIGNVVYRGTFACSTTTSCGNWAVVPNTVNCVPVDTKSTISLEDKGCTSTDKPVHIDVAMLFDASSSMDEEIATARNDVKKLFDDILSPKQDIRISLTRFGGRKKGDTGSFSIGKYCSNVDRVAAMGRITGDEAYTALNSFRAEGLTPIATAVNHVASTDLTTPGRQKFMLLLSDGIETCDRDPGDAIDNMKKSGIKTLGIRYKRDVVDETGDAFGKATFEHLDYYRDVVIRDGETGQNEDLYAALKEMFNIIAQPACTVKAVFYKQGDRTTPILTLDGGQRGELENGTYDVVISLCEGQTQVETLVIDKDKDLTTSLTCPKP